MKKLLVLSLGVLLALTLVGCNGGGGGTASDVELQDSYTVTYMTEELDSMDYVATNKANNHQHNVNFVEGLLENNQYGDYVGAAAESYEANEDSTVWTFHIREGVKWVTSTGEEYADMTAHDFVTGLRHAVDANSETLTLVDSLIVGLADYEDSDRSDAEWEKVGVKAVDDYTLEYTLTAPTTYFYTYTTYAILYPINETFLESKGCPLGEEKSDTCEFGTSSPDSILYSGPFILNSNVPKSEITYVKNEAYWDKDNVFVNTVNYIYDSGEDTYSQINGFENGQYDAAALNASWADYDEYVEKYQGYITMTNTNSYSFGIQWNFNRANFKLSEKTDPAAQQASQDAIHNKNVRLAVMAGLNTQAYMAVNMTDEAALANLRNMNGVPNLVSTSDGRTYGDLVEEAYKELTGEEVDLSDGHMAFYNPEKAMEYVEAAKADGVEFPVHLDLLCISDKGEGYMDRANSMKQSIEESTQGNIIIDVILQPYDTVNDVAFNMTDPATRADYDFNTQAGWGPDYVDPSTFTDVFSIERNGAYLPNIGLNVAGETAETIAKVNEVAAEIGLDEYDRLNDEAWSILDDLDARYEAFAKVDAYLLANALYIPVSMQTRGERMTKVVPFSSSYSVAGTGQYKLKYMKVQTEMITTEQWEAAQEAWMNHSAEQLIDYHLLTIQQLILDKGFKNPLSLSLEYMEEL